MSTADLVTIRSFNRLVTQTVGALNDHYLGRDRPLGEARLLFEIGEGGATASELRARLELDSGYLSRLLRSLERQGFITTRPDQSDKRIRRIRLAAPGLSELKELNRRSDHLAQSILDPLNGKQRTRLVEAMSDVTLLLSAAAVRIDEESPHSRDAQYCLKCYFDELSRRFDTGFDAAEGLEGLEEFLPPHGTFLVMRLRGEPVGCGGFERMPPDSAYVKRMWIADSARGLGLGKKLLHALEERARSMGYRKVRLETNKALSEAQRLYRSFGYEELAPFNDEPYAHHWFEKAFE